MTTDPYLLEQKKRQFTALDGVVFALALAALASPFLARLQSQASAAVPQIAVQGDVSAVRPIDIAMGYDEVRAEAAFFEGLGQPTGLEAELALDQALAAAALDDVPYIDEPMPTVATETEAIFEDDPEFDFEEDLSLARSDSVVVFGETLDAVDTVTPIAGSDSVEIESAVIDAPDPAVKLRVIMSAPPTMTPVPNASPRRAQAAVVEVATLDTVPLELPVDVTPPIEAPVEQTIMAIEESLLPPLEVPSTDGPQNGEVPVVVAELPREFEELPSDVTPQITSPAPIVVAQKAPQPARPPAPVRPPAKVTNGPRIALVIAAAGLNSNVTRFAIEALPEGVTLAFAPIKPEAGELAQEAKLDGHTVLVEIPMEPVNQNRDPGPMTLRVADGPAKNLNRLDQALARISVADGASSYLGARFNADERAAAPVVQALADRGMFFFENEPTSRSVFQRLAARTELPYARGVVKIDKDRSVKAIRRALDDLEKQARRRGYAVGVGTTLRGTISTVALWAKEAEKRDVRLVPITDVGR